MHLSNSNFACICLCYVLIFSSVTFLCLSLCFLCELEVTEVLWFNQVGYSLPNTISSLEHTCIMSFNLYRDIVIPTNALRCLVSYEILLINNLILLKSSFFNFIVIFSCSLSPFTRIVDSHGVIITRHITPIFCTLDFKINIFIPINISFLFLTILSEAFYPSIQTVQSLITQPSLHASHNPQNILRVPGLRIT